MRVDAMRRPVVALMLGALLMVVPTLAQESGDAGKAPEPDKPPPGEVHGYEDATVAAFVKLLAKPEWKPAAPPRNPQGMLEAVHEETELTFVLVPGGSFRMGSPDDERGRYVWEGPVHTVTVPPFLLCRTECTARAWLKSGGDDTFNIMDDDYPVEKVSWTECRDWCAQNGLRLPSEAEWEYACRAGSTGMWCFGDDESLLGQYVASPGNIHALIRPVAGKKPNAWGLHDMHGNSAEWCEDRAHGSYEGAPTDGSAWTTGASSSRVVRGVTVTTTVAPCRSAIRDWRHPGGRGGVLGFRPATDLPE